MIGKQWIVWFMAMGLCMTVWGQKIRPLEDGTILELVSENLANGSWKYGLEIRSRELLDCTNYGLPHTLKVAGDKVIITVKGIEDPADCQKGLGPARTMVDFSIIPAGEYSLKIWVNRQDFAGTLSISAESVTLRLDPSVDKSLMKIPNPKIMAIPSGHVWGWVEYTEPEMEAEIAHFRTDLEQEGARKAELKTGNYGSFYFHEDGSTPARKQASGEWVQPFVYQYNGDLTRLELIQKMYAEKFGTKMKITLVHPAGIPK